MLMLHTGMMGIVLVTGNRENDVKSIASALNEIGVGGLNVEVATDNARAYHWPNISEYRTQAKGVGRAVCMAKKESTKRVFNASPHHRFGAPFICMSFKKLTTIFDCH